MLPAFVTYVSSDLKSPESWCLHVRPAYLARASADLKALISPISAIIPAAHTGPIPGMDSSLFFQKAITSIIDCWAIIVGRKKTALYLWAADLDQSCIELFLLCSLRNSVNNGKSGTVSIILNS